VTVSGSAIAMVVLLSFLPPDFVTGQGRLQMERPRRLVHMFVISEERSDEKPAFICLSFRIRFSGESLP